MKKPSEAPALLAALLAASCGRSPSPSVSAAAAGPAAAVTEEVVTLPPMDEREVAQWAAASANDGDPDDRMRLVDLVGCIGLRQRAARADLRMTALRAMEYCSDFSELPWLVEVGTTGSDAEANVALDAIVQMAARPLRSVDTEDNDELRAGCATLLALARASDRQKERRVLAIRALRMLAERGCPADGGIPTEFDVR